MTNTVNLRTAAQAAIFPLIVNEMKSGYFSTRRGLVVEDWASAKPHVAKGGAKLGINFETPVAKFDLLNENVVESIKNKAIKAVKTATGEEIDLTGLRKELFDMMFIIRSPQDGPLAESHIGQMGGKIGRPSVSEVEALAKPRKARAKKAKAKKAKAKVEA
jgi:hypothetical protein